VDETQRAIAREIAHRHLAAGDALGWFEALYTQANGEPSIIPWADLAPNPNVFHWLDKQRPPIAGRRALKVGCGLGDDAEELARRGFCTTAFDISPTAIRWCTSRYPYSSVSYVVADLFQPPVAWRRAFDLVIESYTLQVLPPELRPPAITRIAEFLAPGGTLLVVARGREPGDPPGRMPWPLIRKELSLFPRQGLREIDFDDYVDGETPPVRRFRALYRREG
jgi:SAM-dependent methyltransferase